MVVARVCCEGDTRRKERGLVLLRFTVKFATRTRQQTDRQTAFRVRVRGVRARARRRPRRDLSLPRLSFSTKSLLETAQSKAQSQFCTAASGCYNSQYDSQFVG